MGDLEHELDEDVLIAGDRKEGKALAAEIVRHIPGLRPVDAGAPRAGPPHRVAHATADLVNVAQQDARRDQADGPPGAALVVLLSGGTGGAKLARGLADVAGELCVVANTG